MKIWACCKRLFSLGLSERRDAYAILSLYISSSSCNKRKDGNIDDNGETFDPRGDKELWIEIKRGLVNNACWRFSLNFPLFHLYSCKCSFANDKLCFLLVTFPYYLIL